MLYFLLSAVVVAADPPAPPTAGAATATAGRLQVEAKLPVELIVDGAKVAQIWAPATVSFDVAPGKHVLRVYLQGEPTDLPIAIEAGQRHAVLVGRTGITLADANSAEGPQDVAATVPVELRSVGAPIQVRIGRERLQLGEGEQLSVELAPGRHRMSVRNAAGTVIWANGTLEVSGRDGLVVQLSDGRMPELFGPGAFHAQGGG